MKKIFKGIFEEISEPEIPEEQWAEVWTGSQPLINGGDFHIQGIEFGRPTRYTFSSGLTAEGTYNDGTCLGWQVMIPVGKNATGPNALLAGSASFYYNSGTWIGVDVCIKLADSNYLKVAIEKWGNGVSCWSEDDMTLHGTLTLTKVEQAFGA